MYGTFVTEAEGDETGNTPLAPFSQSLPREKDTYWDSHQAKKTSKFGYAYPETQAWKYGKGHPSIDLLL